MAVTQNDKNDDSEGEIKEYLDSFLKWFRGGGTSRHVGLTILVLGMCAPFLLGLTMVIVAAVCVAPVANTLSERLAVFGVLFSLLTALSIQLGRASQRLMFGLFFMRRRRQQQKSDKSQA